MVTLRHMHAPARTCTHMHAPTRPCMHARPSTPVHACTPQHARACMHAPERGTPVHACTPQHARERMHARARPSTPVHARARPCTPRARPCTRACIIGHTGAALRAQSDFTNVKRHLCYHTEGPPPRPLSNRSRSFVVVGGGGPWKSGWNWCWRGAWGGGPQYGNINGVFHL